ncbi:ABC transporter ATP-binding protein [Sulfurimonas sp. SWIR-19]|uniref:ABC transporter ATP-binding protein n=1 Tax=Sulfurimonas sp. SWIR-19 TaxID=2878390 RepID=UPI001CF55AF8|nr:ABC transporter ATP-binding protein [Sulfurimonas sp. SWIR-19]UCN00598.1 ABC transporter ATP-binding protein [Sulfurimonas sp. SWIR-19]
MIIQLAKLSKAYKIYTKPIERLKESLSFSKKPHHQLFYALNNVSFSVKKGEVIGILGRNGSGKSTLLKILSGVLTQSGGSVSVRGKVTALLELGSGFNPELTGRENLYLNASLQNFSKKELDVKIAQICEFAEIEEFLDRPFKTYSSGMKARLTFSFSIHTQPEILIIDEALSVGDAAFARKCFVRIEQMCKNENTTVIIVSHSTQTILSLCDRVIVLHKGQKVLEGKPKDIVKLYLQMIHDNKIPTQVIQADEPKQLIKKTDRREKEDHSFYNPALQSKAIVSLEPKGAQIKEVGIFLDGNEVNMLQQHKNFLIKMKVEFSHSFENVIFALFVKTANSQRLGGKEIVYTELFTPSCTYEIEWNFYNRLSHGHYLLNCAVVYLDGEERVLLHRIYDAYMFEVLKPKEISFSGLVDFDLEAKISKEYE